MLIAGVFVRELPDEELTLTPIYLAFILMSRETDWGSRAVIVYFVLLILGIGTLWRVHRLYKAFGFFTGFVAIVTY
jgi:hypothetical protein